MIDSKLRPTLFFLLAVVPAIAFAQHYPQIRVEVRVSDASDSAKYLAWGFDSSATKGFDPALGEIEEPPVPPVGVLDARFIGDSLETGTMLDLRRFFNYAQSDTFFLRYQPSTKGGYPMKFKWSRAFLNDHFKGDVRLTDPIGPGGSLVDINMKLADSVTITDTRFNNVRIIATGPVAPNTISGSVYEDLNGSGVRGAAEPPLAGWTVYLSGRKTAVTTTGPSGTYFFGDLPPGNYFVTGGLPSGWVRTEPAVPPDSISLDVDQGFANGDIGFFRRGSIGGLKFIDLNGNQVQDPGELPLPNWMIYLHGDAEASMLTDGSGSYRFTDLGPGTYTISERQDPDWVQLLPGSPGYYTVEMTSGRDASNLNFGNKAANKYVGPPSGTWSDSSNWVLGRPPGPEDAVVLSVPVVLDSLVQDSVLAVRIVSGGVLVYSTFDSLVVEKSFQIDEGGGMVFPPPPPVLTRFPSLASQPQIICYGDWINRGLFTAGGSLVTLAGDRVKSIMNTTFFDLKIRGNNTTSEGKVGVLNTMYLHSPFGLEDGDTLEIFNPSVNAIVDTGAIPRGTVVRAIQPGEAAPYRFGNPSTTILFTGGADIPDVVAVTCIPDTVSALFDLDWGVVGGTPDTAANTISADTVREFSKWALGTPKPSLRGILAPSTEAGEPVVQRLYTISAGGGTDFAATLKLSYDQSEVPPGTDESALRLLRDPLVAGEVYEGWSMVSIPLHPANHSREYLFPAAISHAYRYAGGYIESPALEFGTGYWLKFPNDSVARFPAYDSDVNTIAVSRGWNMIGTLGFPVSTESIVSDPPGIIASNFYGYRHSYRIDSVLMPVQGYFMRAKAAGTITLRSGIPVAKQDAGADGVPDLNTITIRDGAGREQVLYYSSDPAVDRERFALPPLPPPGGYDVRFASGYQIAQSVGDPSEIPISVSAGEYPLSIGWDANDAGVTASLVIDGREHPMEGKGSVSVPDGKSRMALRLSSHVEIPGAFALRQCYPNPFNPVTTIEYEIPSRQDVVIRVFNLLGQEVETMIEGTREAGIHRIRFDASHLPSGVYFYRIQAGPYSAVMKMALVR